MGRMHTPGYAINDLCMITRRITSFLIYSKGISSSALPYRRSVPNVSSVHVVYSTVLVVHGDYVYLCVGCVCVTSLGLII